jgi:hypothetical protein
MKLSDIKQLKEDTIYKRILDELKVKGLSQVYIKRDDTIDYLDIILSVISFLETNKKVLKKLNQEKYENIIIICIDEILEECGIEVREDQIEKILTLLKNSLLVQRASKFIMLKIKSLGSYLYNKVKNCSCSNGKSTVIETRTSSINVELKEIEKVSNKKLENKSNKKLENISEEN